MNRQQVIVLTQTHKADLEALGVKTLELFASVVRDEASPDSDIDFWVEFAIEPTLFNILMTRSTLIAEPITMISIGARGGLPSGRLPGGKA